MKTNLFYIISLIFILTISDSLNAQCPTTVPTGTDGCSIGSGVVQLDASGSTGYYNWYDAITGGNLIGSGSIYNTPFISSTTNYYPAAAATPSALTLDGSNDFVALNMSYNTTGQINQLTVEAWVNTSETGTGTYDNWAIVDFDRSEYYNLFVRGDNGQVGFSTTDNGGTIHDFYSTTSINDGNWHHIVAVYDGTDKIIYIDGVENVRNVNSHGGNNLGSGNTRFGFIGDGSEATAFNGTRNNYYYNGSVNEIRIWNTARTSAQISANKDVCLTGSEIGLTAYYNINEATGSTLNDLTGNGNNGTLINFNLATAWSIGNLLSCPTCESARQTVTATITGNIDLGADLCLSGGSQTLDAGAGYSTYLWSTGASTQTINVSSSGTYWVTVDNGSGCTGSDTITLSFIPSPTATNGCSFGSGTVDLSVAGSSGYYNWYDASSGGNLVNTGNTYTTPVLAATTNYYVSAVDTVSSLTLDGTNDYGALNMSYNTAGQINQLTLEAWVKTTENGNSVNDNWAIIDFDRSEYYNLYVTGDDGRVGFSTKGNGGSIHDFYSSSSNTVNDGNWHHVVAVYDGTDKIIYIDGIEVDRSVNAHGGSNLGSGTTRFGFIGEGSEATTFNGTRNNIYYKGSIDEVRIWHTTRSAAQISSNKDICLAGTENGLAAYYNLDEGAGSSINDISGNGNQGTLFNVATTVWESGSPITCATCESPRTTVTATIAGSSLNDQQLTCANTSVTLDAGTGFASYLWSTGATTQTINTSQQGIYTVTVSGGGCAGSDTSSVIGFTSSENALTFDGANDYVAIDNYSYNSSTNSALTVEAWIKTSSGGDQIIASFDRNEYWRLEINGSGAGTGQVGFDLMTSTGQLDFGGTTRVDDGKWHHVAGVFNNGVVSIYVDGVLDATTLTGSTFGSGNTRFGFVGVGSEATTFNGTTGPLSEFNGEMDEVRIWSSAKTQAQIRNSMCSHVPGNETGLDIYFKFDETAGTTINDYSTSTVSSGTMINFGGAAFNTSTVPLGDLSTHSYPASWSGQSINLASCDGDNATIENVTGSPVGTHLYYINNHPTASSGILNYTANNHYFGSHTINGTSPQYDISYSYPGHSLVMAGDDADLVLMTRADNSVNSWTLSSSSVNTTTQKITLTNQTSEQFLIDKYQIQWIGITSTDWATGTNWNSGSVPGASASILVPDVINQPVLDQNRVIGSLTIEASADADLNGFELTLEQGFINDGNLISNNGTLKFNGSTDIQYITANVDLNLDNLTIDNTNGVTLSTGSINLQGTLTLTNGVFNTGGNLTVLSNPTGTGRIAEITGGSITGNVTMQRYIDAGSTDWRFLTSAISGTTLADFNDDFVTSGFIGSDYPDWPSVANRWPSIYFYDESVAGIQDNGYVAAANITDPLAVGEGIWVWSGDTSTGTQPFTIDVTGTINTGNINLPVTYTNSGNPSDDGWNMVGNPYPSTLDWDDASITKTNINNAIYIWNPDLQQFASYVAGFGINGGSKNIASSQAFWVQATSAGASIQVTEASKTSVDASFLKVAQPSLLSIVATNGFGTDQTIVNFNPNATNGFDGMYDALKLGSVNTDLPSISTVMNDSVAYSINQLSESGIELPLKLTSSTSGIQNIVFNGISEFDEFSCIILEDLFTGLVHDLRSDSAITVFISDATTTARFLLKFGAVTTTTVTDVSCFAANDAKIVFKNNGVNTFDIAWKDNQGNTIVNNSNIMSGDSIANLSSGVYNIETVDGICGVINQTVTVTEPAQITPLFTTTNVTATTIDFNNQTSNATTYFWDFGDGNTSTATNPTNTYLSNGVYTVYLTAYQSATCFKVYDQQVNTVVTGIKQLDNNSNISAWINNKQLIVKGDQIENVVVRNVLGQTLFTSNEKQTFNLNDIAPQTLIVIATKEGRTITQKISYTK